MLMSAFLYCRILSFIQLAFTSGTLRSAAADALTTKSLTNFLAALLQPGVKSTAQRHELVHAHVHSEVARHRALDSVRRAAVTF